MVVNNTHTILHNAILNGEKNLTHRLVVRFFTAFRISLCIAFRMGVYLVCLLWSAQSPAQQLLNGSFEEHDLDTINCHHYYNEINAEVDYIHRIGFKVGLFSEGCIFGFTSDSWGPPPTRWGLVYLD